MNDWDDEQRPRDPSMEDTVADEEVAPAEGEGGESGAAAGERSGEAAFGAEDSVPLEPEFSAPPPPLPPRFREESERAQDFLAQHAAEVEARRNGSEPASRRPPARVQHRRESDRRWSEDLGDTPSLLDSRAGGAMTEAELERVEVDEIFDRPDQVVGSTAQYDPEAGRTNVAIKIQAVRQVVRSATTTPFGRLIIALPIGLAGVTLTIVALIMQTLYVTIAAAIVMPLGAWLLYVRYQAWLGHKRYMYRLLETLGEDVSDFDMARTYRRVGKVVKGRR